MERPAVDLGELVDRLGGDREAVAELVEIFLDDTPSLVAEIRDGADDLVRLRRAAHTLKGASGNMGAHGACECAGALQSAAASGDREATARARTALLEEMARVFAELVASRATVNRRMAS